MNPLWQQQQQNLQRMREQQERMREQQRLNQQNLQRSREQQERFRGQQERFREQQKRWWWEKQQEEKHLKRQQLVQRRGIDILGQVPETRSRFNSISRKTFPSSRETLKRVQRIIADQLELSLRRVDPYADISADLGADSLDVVELIMALEEEFDLEIPDEDAEYLRTPSDIAEYISGA